MSTVTRNVVVRLRADAAPGRYVSLGEMSDFLDEAIAAGAQPDDKLYISGSLSIQIPSDEERATAARCRS